MPESTPEKLAELAGVVLSLALGYIPGLRAWYDALDNPRKVTLTGGLLVATAVAVLAWGCRADAAGVVACVVAGWEPMATVLVGALIGNQAGYLLLVKPFKAAS